MATPKDEHLVLIFGIGLAGMAISNFYEAGRDAFETFRDEIFDVIVKANILSLYCLYICKILLKLK